MLKLVPVDIAVLRPAALFALQVGNSKADGATDMQENAAVMDGAPVAAVTEAGNAEAEAGDAETEADDDNVSGGLEPAPVTLCNVSDCLNCMQILQEFLGGVVVKPQ